jgi:hypothetical protein
VTESYRRWQPAEAKVQALQQGGLGAHVEASGWLKDDIADRFQEAATAGFPDLGPADALPWIGKERILPRLPGEAENVYRERLRNAWLTWSKAGTLGGMLDAVTRLGLPAAGNMYLIEEGGKYSYLVSGTVTSAALMVQRHTGRAGWWFDERPLNTRFAFLFDTDDNTLNPLSTLGPPSIASLTQTVNTWRPSSATYFGFFVKLTGTASGTHLLGWPTTQVLGTGGWTLGGYRSRTVYPDGSFRVLG